MFVLVIWPAPQNLDIWLYLLYSFGKHRWSLCQLMVLFCPWFRNIYLSRCCLPGFIGKLYFTSIDWMLNDYSSLILDTIHIMVQTYPPIPLSMCSKSHQFTLACQSWKTTSQCMFDQHQAMIRLHEIISCHQPLPVNINRWSVCPLLTEFMNVCDNVVILFANLNCRVENLGIFILFQNFRMS